MVCASRSVSESVLMLDPLCWCDWLAVYRFRYCRGGLQLAVAEACHFAGVPNELTSTVFPGIFERECAADVARQRQRLETSDAQILVQYADRVVGNDVFRPRDRIGGNWTPTRQRFDLHDSERVGATRKDEDVGSREMRGKYAVVHMSEEF